MGGQEAAEREDYETASRLRDRIRQAEQKRKRREDGDDEAERKEDE